LLGALVCFAFACKRDVMSRVKRFAVAHVAHSRAVMLHVLLECTNKQCSALVPDAHQQHQMPCTALSCGAAASTALMLAHHASGYRYSALHSAG
jgi:hypothetical protein